MTSNHATKQQTRFLLTVKWQSVTDAKFVTGSSILTYGFLLCTITLRKADMGARGGVVVKALPYKSAGRGFDSRWCHWNFSAT
jgi:hypothetical protein